MANEETMLRHTFGFVLAIATIAFVVSCGSDSEEKPANTGDAGNVTGVGCGSIRCQQLPETTDPPCCQEQFIGKCGVQRGGRCADIPAVADPRCPSVPLPAGIGNLTSCCVN